VSATPGSKISTTEGISVAAAAGEGQPKTRTAGRRELFALAAVLTATTLTGVAAIAGVTRNAPAGPTTPRIGQILTPAPQAPPRQVEPGD